MSLWGIASCIRGGLRCRASLASHHQIRLQVGQGCSRWYSDATVKNEPENEKIGFMDDSDIEELDIDISDFKVDHVEPLTLANIKSNVNAEDPKAISKRPALPRSIKTLNRALGRKQRIEIPEEELIEQFVRGERYYSSCSCQVEAPVVKQSTRQTPQSHSSTFPLGSVFSLSRQDRVSRTELQRDIY